MQGNNMGAITIGVLVMVIFISTLFSCCNSGKKINNKVSKEEITLNKENIQPKKYLELQSFGCSCGFIYSRISDSMYLIIEDQKKIKEVIDVFNFNSDKPIEIIKFDKVLNLRNKDYRDIVYLEYPTYEYCSDIIIEEYHIISEDSIFTPIKSNNYHKKYYPISGSLRIFGTECDKANYILENGVFSDGSDTIKFDSVMGTNIDISTFPG